MNCQTGAAHLFLENIYTMLTNQKLPDCCSQETITVDDLVASYALPTTSSMIRQMSGSPHKSKIIFDAHRKLQRMRHNRLVSTDAPQLAK